ncbi:MAG: hypothetical protein Q7R30_09685 [Acidobacteriota bacterium]|nr:hypothetical protein [Acidobacteriota bacterium]
MRLDPNVSTGVEYTLVHLIERLEDVEKIAARCRISGPDVRFALGTLGGPAIAREVLRDLEVTQVPPALRSTVEALAASVFQPVDEAIRQIEHAISAHVDPEALFMLAMLLVRLGAVPRGLEVIGRAVGAGYTPVSTLARNYVFDPVRGDAPFAAIEAEARRRMLAASAVFEREGGPALLGMPPATRLYPV